MKKLSNKTLLIALVVLVGIFGASRLFRSPARESNLRRDLISTDTAAITELRILPGKDRSEEIKITREGNGWKVSKGNRVAGGDRNYIKSALTALYRMQAQRQASRKKEKWEEFNVGEKSTHVSGYAGERKVVDVHIGKLGFAQGGSGGFGGSYTYVRLSDEDEVYTVQGFLESSFNNAFNDWRNKTLSKVNKDDIVKISFRYPADSGFVVEKRDSIWYAASEKANPAKVDALANQLSAKYLTEFADDIAAAQPADVTIIVDGKAGTLAIIEAWKKGDEWIFSGSAQKGVYFSSKGSTVVKDILIGQKQLLPGIGQ